MWNKKMAAGYATTEDIRKLYEQVTITADKVYEEDVKPTYNKEVENLAHEIANEETPPEETEEIDPAIQKAIEEQIKEKEKPKKKKTKLNLEKLAEPTQEEIEEAQYKDMIGKYAGIAVRMKNGEQQ
jgi:hypothetical protein